jgi:hypothetical protein
VKWRCSQCDGELLREVEVFFCPFPGNGAPVE